MFDHDKLCPYCFDSFPLGGTPYRCTQFTRCAPEVDPVRKARWGEDMPLGKVLPPGCKGRCPHCGDRLPLRLCPGCHMELPKAVVESDNLIFALVGAKDAGKSHYLAVLVTQIEEHVGPLMDILLSPVNEDTMKRFKERYKDPLYKRGIVIRGTQSARTDVIVQRPLIFSLEFSRKGLFGARKRIHRSITIVFFDTAGEDLDDENVMSSVNKYIFRADGIILLLDPLQLGAVRDRLEGAALPGQNTETVEIVQRMTNLIRRGRGLPENSEIPTPLAVALSKLDAVAPLLDPQLQLHASPNHDSGFDRADFSAINAEVQALLRGWQGESMAHQVRMRYRHHAFFGLSALGVDPLAMGGKVGRIQPRRVEDPFLWLLHYHGLIRAR